jgi:predicted O-methyltransferase YrrM
LGTTVLKREKPLSAEPLASPAERPLVTYLLATTAFLSAFLLFLVQPLIVKRIVPWFGGGTSVWNGSMLFFQVVLFLGYVYAHWLARAGVRTWKVALHVVLLVAALALLPIIPDADWKGGDPAKPLGRILALLAATVGLPYFLLATTAPLVQVWHARLRPTGSPYRLYALSNAGSLLALIGYPVVVEPLFGLQTQAWTWSGGFVVYAVLAALGMLAWWRFSGRGIPATSSAAPTANSHPSTASPPGAIQWTLWLLLPACASTLLLAVTNYICQDVASVPLLWIAPLALYLISFILTFDSDFWYRRWVFIPLLGVSSVAVFFCWASGPFLSLLFQVGAHLLLLFSACMACHGELVRLRPASQYLTAFYLALSGGGALGGVFVNLVAPLVFFDFYELPFAIALTGALIAGVVFLDARFQRLGSLRLPIYASTACLLLFYIAVLIGYFEGQIENVLTVRRNFYGVLKVRDRDPLKPKFHRRELHNGRISHGMQFADGPYRLTAVQYYDEESGVGLAMKATADRPRRTLGLVGLGVGMVTAYGRETDRILIYEINPNVADLAREYFTYLESCKSSVEIILGDARVNLEREAPHEFDVLVLDAFSGDSIPIHLLTEDAGEMMLKHMAPDGILAIHISNIHLDLMPVTRGWAERFALHARYVETDDTAERGIAASTWVMLCRDEEPFRKLGLEENMSPPNRMAGIVHWTDDHSNLWSVVRTDRLAFDLAAIMRSVGPTSE